jgi:hypothetical protein
MQDFGASWTAAGKSESYFGRLGSMLPGTKWGGKTAGLDMTPFARRGTISRYMEINFCANGTRECHAM